MSPGYQVDKQPTWHPIWRARYRVAVDCRPEVPVPRSTDRLLPGFAETFCGAGLRPGPAIHTRRRELPWPIYDRRALALPSLDYYRLCTARVHPRRGAGYRPPSLRRARACRRDLCHQLTSPPRAGRYTPIIALTLPELNRSTSVATMPSGSVGSE